MHAKNLFNSNKNNRLPRFIKFIISISSILLLNSMYAMGQNRINISSWIEKDTVTHDMQFTAFFKNHSKENINELSYQFYGLKESKSGKSNISQSGEFQAKPEEKISLSTIKLNNIKGGNVRINLDIFHQDSLLVKDSLEIKP